MEEKVVEVSARGVSKDSCPPPTGRGPKYLEERVEELEKQLGFYKMVATASYASQQFMRHGGTYLFNLIKPRTFNEKIIWLRENYWTRHPLNYYKTDKYFFKYFTEKLFGKEHVLPLLGVWDSAEDINFDLLPDKFVLKRTLSGGALEVKMVNKASDDLESVRRLAKIWVGNPNRVCARIMAERALNPWVDEKGDNTVLDYKFFVIHGKVRFINVLKMSETGGRRYSSWYNIDLTRIPLVEKNHPKFEPPFPKKDLWDKMIQFAEKAGSIFPVIRVDMYVEKDNFYLGELTDVHNNGVMPINPIKYDRAWGNMIHLPSELEMQADFAKAYELFPELKINPVFLESTMNMFYIVQPTRIDEELPTPPLPFMQPMKRE